MDTCEKWLTHLRFNKEFIKFLGHWNYEELINIITDIDELDIGHRLFPLEKTRLLYHINKIRNNPTKYFNYLDNTPGETKTEVLVKDIVLKEESPFINNIIHIVDVDEPGIYGSEEVILIEDNCGEYEDEDEDEDSKDSENPMKISLDNEEAFEKVYTFLESYKEGYSLKKNKGGSDNWYSFSYKKTIIFYLEGNGPHVYGKGWITTPTLKKQHNPDRYSSLKSPSWNFEKWHKTHSRYAFNYSGKELDSISTLIDFLTP